MDTQEGMLSLSGAGWLANYYQSKITTTENEFNIEDLRLHDGVGYEAHLPSGSMQGWYAAAGPGDVRDVLIAAGEMAEPYVDRNTHRSRWVEHVEWFYRRDVEIPREWADRRVFLRFDGIDGRAEVWWDGVLLGTHDDMFMPVEFELGEHGSVGPHVLVVRLFPPPQGTCNHFLDGRVPPRGHVHKMQCAWGWDWSRPMISLGIWQDVSLVSSGAVRINDVFVQAEPKAIDNPVTADTGVDVTMEIDGVAAGATYRVTICDPTGRTVGSAEGVAEAVTRATLAVSAAQLWWPSGYGEQPMYTATVEVRVDGRISDRRETTFGVRRLRTLPNTDSPAGAYNHTYEVNGVKIFAAGVNWAPVDLLPGRITRERYDLFLRKAKAAGVIFLRVWGGGLLEKEAFYDLCDRYGLVVWQEFPLAGANYPQDKAFLDHKRLEAASMVRRIRNHPCLVLWCGGNEVDYYGMSPFHPVFGIFREAVERHHPGIDFHTSSPDRSRPGEVDHGPWWYNPHGFWNEHFRLFCSEFGCQAPPAMSSIERFISESQRFIGSPSFEHHYLNFREFYGGMGEFSPKDLSEWVYYAQMIQADSLSYVISVYRSRQFRSSGALFWQFQSSWPEGAYSIVDYYGRPKMALYWLRAACQPTAVILTDADWRVDVGQTLEATVHLANGLPKRCVGVVACEVWTSAGLADRQTFEVDVAGESAASLGTLAVSAAKLVPGPVLVRSTLTRKDGSAEAFDRVYFVGATQELVVEKDSSDVAVERTSAGQLVVVNRGSVPVFALELVTDAELSDNAMHLLPGERRVLTVSGEVGELHWQMMRHGG